MLKKRNFYLRYADIFFYDWTAWSFLPRWEKTSFSPWSVVLHLVFSVHTGSLFKVCPIFRNVPKFLIFFSYSGTCFFKTVDAISCKIVLIDSCFLYKGWTRYDLFMYHHCGNDNTSESLRKMQSKQKSLDTQKYLLENTELISASKIFINFVIFAGSIQLLRSFVPQRLKTVWPI